MPSVGRSRSTGITPLLGSCTPPTPEPVRRRVMRSSGAFGARPRTGRVSQVPMHSFVACCPSQPRRAGSLLVSTLRDPHGLHPLRRAGHSHLRVSRPFGSLALRPATSSLRGFGAAIAAGTARMATRVVDWSHGLLLSSSVRAWTWPVAPKNAKGRTGRKIDPASLPLCVLCALCGCFSLQVPATRTPGVPCPFRAPPRLRGAIPFESP